MYAERMLFCEEIANETVNDEIDELFSKLEQVEPPPSLIEDILATVAHLPLPQYLTFLDDEEEIEFYESGIMLQIPSGNRLS